MGDMSPMEHTISGQSVLRHRRSASRPQRQNRHHGFANPLPWLSVLLLLTLPALACTLTGSPPPDPTATSSPTPTMVPTGTPMPEATTPPTPTFAPTPKVSPTRRSVLPTVPPTAEPSPEPPTAEASSPTMSTGNLLTNPSFEGPYTPYQGKQEWNLPEGWVPWYFSGGGTDLPPEFKPAEAPYVNRIHGGARAVQYFKTMGTYHAGVFQKIQVVPGVKLRFTIYGQAWSHDGSGDCSMELSCHPAFMGMRIGIDPLGGSNPRAESVEWSAFQSPTDGWVLFTVEAVAQADLVTVFAWSAPNKPRRSQDTYWDDASLEVVP